MNASIASRMENETGIDGQWVVDGWWWVCEGDKMGCDGDTGQWFCFWGEAGTLQSYGLSAAETQKRLTGMGFASIWGQQLCPGEARYVE